MFLDYSNIKLDAYGRPETPTLFLQTLSGETIGILGGVSDLNIHVKFSEPSELNFDISSKIESNGSVIDNPMYKEIVGQRVIHTKVYGNYIIMNPESDSDGIKDEIHVTAYSLEKHWEKKILFLEEGGYNFWNPVDRENTILDNMVSLMPGWSVGYVSPTLIGKHRVFDQYDDYLLDFAYNTIPEKYRCVCVFDTYEKTINVYDIDEQYDTIPIYLDFDNLLESVNVTELTDELVTAISPYGEDNLDIRDVNPIGSNWIYDLSYFISNGDIPSALATKWDAWQTAILSHREMYYGLVALRNSKMAQVLSENAAIVDMDGILSGYRYNQSVTLQAIKMEITDEGREEQEEVLEGINQQIADQEAAIAEKKGAVEDLEDEIAELNGEIAAIVNEIKFTQFFTDEEQATLSNYIIEMVLTEETFVSSTFSGSGQVSGAAGTTSGAVEIEDSAITRISLNEDYGKTMYTFNGGTFSHSGDFDVSGDIIRGTLEIGTSDQKFIMTAYLGDMTVDDDRYSSATVTLYGDSSNETDDIASVMDGEVETFEGTDLSFIALSDTYLYVSTSVSEFEKYSVQLELLDYAKSTLKDLATPSYEFSVDSGNFVFAKEFEQFRDELQLGRGIHLNLGHGEVITPYIIEIAIDFEDHSKLDLVFSNKFKRHDQVNTLKDMIEKSYSSSRSFDASKYTYNRTANKQSEVDKFMSGALDAAKNTIIAAPDQSVVIDGAGIRVNGNISDGNTDKNVELRIVNGMIAMTDDNWNDAKLAIGYFKTDSGSYYGVNADVIAGKLLVGNNLVIETPTDNGVMQFKVDSSGAWLYNSQLLLQSDDGCGIMIHPDYGFVVGGTISDPLYDASGTTLEPSFIDENGNVVIETDGMPTNVNFYIDTEGNVNMRGNITATSGDIGGWIIADNKLYSGSGSTYVALNTSTSGNEANYAIWAGDSNAASAPFFVKRDGTVKVKLEPTLTEGEISAGDSNSSSYFHVSPDGHITATAGTFGGSLSAATGTFAGELSAATGTFTGTLSAGTVSGGTVTGATITGGSINIGNNNFMVDSSGNVTLAGNITWSSSNNPVTKANVMAALDTSSSTDDGIYVSDGKIKLNASAIGTGTIEASYIELAGNMNVYIAEGGTTVGGFIGYASGSDGSSTTNGIRLSDPSESNYIIATNSGCRMTASDTNLIDMYVTINGPVMRNGGNKQISVSSSGPIFSNGSTSLTVSSGAFTPSSGVTLGSSSHKWDTVYASSGTIDTSDRNQKKNISYNIDEYIDVIDLLKPASYKLIDGTSDRRHIGMIAQDVEEVIEELGIDSKDFAAFVKDETEDGDTIYGLRYGEFIPLLIAKIQKQQQQIDYLLSQIEE